MTRIGLGSGVLLLAACLAIAQTPTKAPANGSGTQPPDAALGQRHVYDVLRCLPRRKTERCGTRGERAENAATGFDDTGEAPRREIPV